MSDLSLDDDRGCCFYLVSRTHDLRDFTALRAVGLPWGYHAVREPTLAHMERSNRERWMPGQSLVALSTSHGSCTGSDKLDRWAEPFPPTNPQKAQEIRQHRCCWKSLHSGVNCYTATARRSRSWSQMFIYGCACIYYKLYSHKINCIRTFAVLCIILRGLKDRRNCRGGPIVAQQVKNRTLSLWGFRFDSGPATGLRIQQCLELQCASQMWLRSGIAVAVAVAVVSSYSSDPTPSSGTSYAAGAAVKRKERVPTAAQWKWIWLVTMRLQVRSLDLLSGLRIQSCHEPRCRSQTWLRSCVAVAVV